jgi:hypothetical protein
MAGFKDKRDLNRYPRSGLANSGRAAGMGILYDNYDEESYRGVPHESYQPDPKLNKYTEEEWEELTEEKEVKTYKIPVKEAKEL